VARERNAASARQKSLTILIGAMIAHKMEEQDSSLGLRQARARARARRRTPAGQ